MPPELGNWHTIYTRFARLKKTEVWGRILDAVSDGVDLEEVFIDSTAIRAHLHAAGAQKNVARRHWAALVAAGAPRST
ncbi:hypothetical protein AB6713_04580 [Luteimonas sp. B3_2_R+30]|uniref:Transposase n=1 Tax=Luteimonas salinilitoris TaxID=3237697 RepID=A0ABV4HME0_9GAMM